MDTADARKVRKAQMYIRAHSMFIIGILSLSSNLNYVQQSAFSQKTANLD